MNKNKKMIMLSALSLSLLIPQNTTFAEGTINEYNQQIDELKDKVSTNQNNKEELEKELHHVHNNIAEVESELKEIKAKIADTDKRIKDSEAKINATKKEIDSKVEEINDTEEELKQKKDTLSQNLRAMYKRGEVSMMEMIFKSDGLEDLVYRVKVMKDITRANDRLYEEVKEKAALLKEQKAELDKKQEIQKQQKSKLDDLKTTQIEQRKKQDALLAQHKEKEKEVLEHIKEEEAAEQALMGQIASIIAEREAEKKRIEEEKKKQESANNESGSNGENEPQIEEAPGDGKISHPMRSGTYTFTSPYGYRIHPVYGTKRLHNGMDFAAPRGTPMYSIADGRVLFARSANGYGNWIVIEHEKLGLYSIYGHMYANEMYVSQGQRVSRGQHIAGVGSAGTSTGNHLHFSLANGFNGSQFTYVNPASYIGY